MKSRGRRPPRLRARSTRLDDAAQMVQRAISKFTKWGALEGTLRLYFETVAFEPDEAVALIERTLNVKRRRGGGQAACLRGRSFTQRNKAKRSRYPDEMDEAQQARMLELFAPFIERVCVAKDEEWYRAFRGKLLAPARRPKRSRRADDGTLSAYRHREDRHDIGAEILPRQSRGAGAERHHLSAGARQAEPYGPCGVGPGHRPSAARCASRSASGAN